MDVSFEPRALKKRFPLAISRGVKTHSDNVFVLIEDERGTRGTGESTNALRATPDFIGETIRDLSTFQRAANTLSIRQAHALGMSQGLYPAALAGYDIARWDLLAKQAELPLFTMLGFAKSSVPTSITVGLLPAEVTKERVPLLLRETGCRALKIKLGSPEGIDYDQAHFEAAREAAQPFGAALRVDANGGWSPSTAASMMKWLAARGVAYVEQPLPTRDDDALKHLYSDRPLPIFVDESCETAADVVRLADRVDGVNIKLMKCGGITGALQIIETAKSHGLKLMIGCYGESSIAIGAAASLGATMNYIDLDAHLNLDPDPADGPRLIEGVVTPPDQPGHGGTLRSETP